MFAAVVVVGVAGGRLMIDWGSSSTRFVLVGWYRSRRTQAETFRKKRTFVKLFKVHPILVACSYQRVGD